MGWDILPLVVTRKRSLFVVGMVLVITKLEVASPSKDQGYSGHLRYGTMRRPY